MKKILSFFTGIVLVIHSFCQDVKPPLTKEDYLKKAKSQKTIGSILIAGGLTAGTVGAIIFLSGFSKGWDRTNPDNGESQMNTGNAFAIVGGVLIVSGIPFMFATKKNKKRALSAGLIIEKMPAISHGSKTMCYSYPALGVHLHLGKSKWPKPGKRSGAHI